MRAAYFDCFSGASGDMILGSLLDAGLPLDDLQQDVRSLGLNGVKVCATEAERGGIRGTRVEVIAEGAEASHRRLRDIVALIEASRLPDRAKSDASRVFRRLAEVEADVHGTTPDAVHFHEVGAVDSIVDIVGACAALARMRIDQVCFSRLAVGRGFVDCAHGRLPVPAPATARLIEGFEVAHGVADGELLTPTGAAILTTLGQQTRPVMRSSAVGYGTGRRDRSALPNLLRVWVGDVSEPAEADEVWVLETNLDDCTPEVIGHALDCVWEAGALDVFVTPVQMKKGRPGSKVTVVAAADRIGQIEDVLFGETPTFGVRRHPVMRSKLAREAREVETPYGKVRVKVGRRGGRAVTCEPEYEDCRRAAAAWGVSLRQVMERAKQGASDLLS